MSTLPEIGQEIANRYEIVAAIQESPAYVAFRAFDRDVEVEVALWWIRPSLFDSPEALSAFLQRAEQARSVSNPHLLRMFSAGTVDDTAYVVYQLPTSSASDLHLRPGVEFVDAALVLNYARALCAGLGACHNAGQLHGKLLPDDLSVVAGQIKIAGTHIFSTGLAEVGRQLWRHHHEYIAPEIWEGVSATVASDVYSMAAVLRRIAAGGMKNPDEFLAKASRRFAAALQEALNQAPDSRPERPDLLLDRLEDALEPTVTDGSTIDMPPAFDAMLTDPSVSVAETDPDASAIPNVHELPTAIGTEALGDNDDVTEVSAAPKLEEFLEPEDSLDGDASASITQVDLVRAETEERPDGATPYLAAVDRPDMRPKVVAPTQTQKTLGRIAAPRSVTRRKRNRVWALSIGGMLAIGLTVVVLWPRNPERHAAPKAVEQEEAVQIPSAEVQATAPSPEPACPVEMKLVADSLCIDAFESPGRGRLPETGVSLAEAEAGCKGRGARLCAAEEWESSCRADRKSSWPYGDAEQVNICNVESGELGPTGSWPRCRNLRGVFDMSGNVAEWVSDGQIRGGSALDGTDARCSVRRFRPERQEAYSDVGYRCCLSL